MAPRLQAASTDRHAPRLEQDAVVMEDGAQLPLRSWLPPGPARAAILAVHGLNDYSGAFEVTGAFLAARGFAVYAHDQRGFGRTAQTGLWAGGDRMADDVVELARLLRSRHPDVPLYGLGESMGGTVLLHALHREEHGWIDAVALTAPAVWSRSQMHRYQRLPLNVLTRLWPGLKLSSRMARRAPTDDPDRALRLRSDPFVLHWTRMDVLSGLADLMDAVTFDATAPGVPALVLYGAHDEIVPPAPTCAWLKTLGPADGWQVALYPSGWHLLTRDRNAARVLADLAAWFERPGVGLPSGADTEDPIARVCALGGR
jgi:acylglycerol lipase